MLDAHLLLLQVYKVLKMPKDKKPKDSKKVCLLNINMQFLITLMCDVEHSFKLVVNLNYCK